MNKKEFNKKQYDIAYQKENQAQFNVRLLKEEKQEIDEFLKANNFTKIYLIRKGYQKLKEKIKKKQIENEYIKSIFLLNDIIRLFIEEQDDAFTKGKLSIRDIYCSLRNNYEKLPLKEIEIAIKKLEDNKIVFSEEEEYSLNL